MRLAKGVESSPRSPARRLKTPAGRSLVAMISEKVRGASAFAAEARATTELPLAMMGAMIDTNPSKADSSGVSATTTPSRLGNSKIEMRGSDRIYRAKNLRKLVGPTRVIHQAINRSGDFAARPGRGAIHPRNLALQLPAPRF